MSLLTLTDRADSFVIALEATGSVKPVAAPASLGPGAQTTTIDSALAVEASPKLSFPNEDGGEDDWSDTGALMPCGRGTLTLSDTSSSTLESCAESIASLYEPFVFDDGSDTLAIDKQREHTESGASRQRSTRLLTLQPHAPSLDLARRSSRGRTCRSLCR